MGRRIYPVKKNSLELITHRVLNALTDNGLNPTLAQVVCRGLRIIDSGYESMCWIRGDDSTVYTYLLVEGKQTVAHRFVYNIFHSKPLRYDGCHKCDVPACINPDHIFDGTQADNNRDAISKKRLILNEFAVSKIKKEIAINKQAENFSEPQLVSGVDRQWNQFPSRDEDVTN